MSARYGRLNTTDDDDRDIHGNYSTSGASQARAQPPPIPNSPPPSFHSVINGTSDSALEDSFDAPSDDEDDDMRNVRRTQNSNTFHESIPLVPTANSSSSRPANLNLPSFPRASTPSSRVITGSNDGVFANLNAKPTVEAEKVEELPPSYEQAAADAPPPFWETTILAPGMGSDEVFIDGLPVGSVFAFVWNAMISMSFQLVGFLLTYLLHTTHAAKNGSRAGLGVTLIQYGFYLRSSPDEALPGGNPDQTAPPDPNSYEFSSTGEAISEMAGDSGSIGSSELLSYLFMIVGWFILIRSVSDFIRARRTEAVILQSPERGLGIPVVAEGETPDRSV